MALPREKSILVSSDPSNGARNVSKDGSSFEIQLEEGINIPKNAENITIQVDEAVIWNVVPNIVEINNTMYITGPDINDVIQNYILKLPTGLYDLPRLNASILSDLEANGAKIDPNPLISLSPDSATQRVLMRFYYSTVSVDFTQNDTFREILGFNSQIVGPFILTPVNILADNTAAFNQVNSFLLHSDLTNTGLLINSIYNQTISQILITSKPGSQILHRPLNVLKIDTPELASNNIRFIRIWLTDDKNRPVNTLNEFYTARIVIKYFA